MLWQTTLPMLSMLGSVFVAGQSVIELSLTVRDFLPNPCMSDAEIRYYANYTVNGKANPHGSNYANGGCDWNPSGDGVTFVTRDPSIKAHPDFYSFEVPDATNGEKGLVKDRLEYTSSGLGRPVYCTDTTLIYPNLPDRALTKTDFCIGESLTKTSTTGAHTFSQWFEDVPSMNKRVAVSLPLTTDPIDSKKVSYQSSRFLPINSAARSEDPAESGTVWPSLKFELSTANRNNHFTTELHTFFEYREGSSFSFRGDDDVWVFVNGTLALDLGGLHGPLGSDLDLNNLGLVPGEVYALDMFHAERRYSGSNYKVTTSLVSSCNVVNVPTEASDIVQLDTFVNATQLMSFSRAKIVNDVLQLSSPSDQYTWSHAWFRTQVNVERGITVEFTYSAGEVSDNVVGDSLGFALQTTGLNDLQGGVGGHYATRGLRGVFVVLDFCSHRKQKAYPLACENGNVLKLIVNNVTVAQAPVYQRLTDGKTHHIRISYYSKPNWIEVFHDNSLWLRASDIDIRSILNQRGGYAGFVSSTSSVAGYKRIHSASLKSVGVSPEKTQLTTPINISNSSQTNTEDLTIADGNSPVSFSIQTFDYCGKGVDYGGLGELLNAQLVEIPGTAALLNNVSNWQIPSNDTRKLQVIGEYYEYSSAPNVVNGLVLDDSNGGYTVNFVTEIAAGYEVVLEWNGEPVCGNVTTNNGTEQLCSPFPNAVSFREFIPEPTAPPTVPVTEVANTGLPEEVVTGLAAAGGVFGLCFIVFTGLFVRYRKEWMSNMGLIAVGRIFRMEREVDYDNNPELAALAGQMQATREEINKLKAMGNSNGTDLKGRMQELEDQKREIGEQLRQLKKEAQLRNTNRVSFASRARMSIRKRRTFRQSMGWRLRPQSSDNITTDIVADALQISQPPPDEFSMDLEKEVDEMI